MILFWFTAAALAGLVAIPLVVTLNRHEMSQVIDQAREVEFYQSQLAEIDIAERRDQLSQEDAEQSRREVSRRLIGAFEKAKSLKKLSATSPRAFTLSASGLLALILIPGALAIHSQLGAPGMSDLPLQERLIEAERLRMTRPSQEEVINVQDLTMPIPDDTELIGLVEELRGKLSDTTDNIEGLRLLVRGELSIGQVRRAIKTQQRLIALLGKRVLADDYSQLADLLVLEAKGYVSPEAETAIMQTLALDEKNSTARYHLGMMFGQTGRPDVAVSMWSRLVENLPPNSPMLADLRINLPEAARLAGMTIQLPSIFQKIDVPTLDKETAQSVASMSETERAGFIESMVRGLQERLYESGGSREEWSQLIYSLLVIGDSNSAQESLEKVRNQFADRPEDIRFIIESTGIE